jgi:putative membrane protein insertion efficiency factor
MSGAGEGVPGSQPGAPVGSGAGPSGPRRLGRWPLLLAVALALFAADLLRPASNQLSAAALVQGIDLYRHHLSPRLGGSCRFRPTCSNYGRQVISRDGALVGSARTAARIARCGPWTPKGTVDPP